MVFAFAIVACERPVSKAPTAVSERAKLAPVSHVVIHPPPWLQRALAEQPHSPVAPPCPNATLVTGLSALAARERSIYRCCDNESPISEFSVGCMLHQSCAYHVSTADGWAQARTRQELARILGPARSNAEAVGRVALVERADLLTSGERPSGVSGRALDVDAAVVTAASGGYDVAIPVTPACDCEHPVQLQRYHVDAAGLPIRGENSVLLADPSPPLCVD